MAQLYALNTQSIAAAVYSSPDPYSDTKDLCEQTPFATTMTPLMDIHNACDIIGICQTGTRFHKDLAKLCHPRRYSYGESCGAGGYPTGISQASLRGWLPGIVKQRASFKVAGKCSR